MIFFSEEGLRNAVFEFVAHDHGEEASGARQPIERSVSEIG